MKGTNFTLYSHNNVGYKFGGLKRVKFHSFFFAKKSAIKGEELELRLIR